MADESYSMPRGAGEAVIVEKRSRFIGSVCPVFDEREAVSFLQGVKTAHREARHNVYAYVLRDNGLMRYSDDGEPQGTAGMPVLEVFRREGIFNVCCVVTRYFGGILLGAAGLTRAYAATAKAALDAAGIATMRRWRSVTLTCPYTLLQRVKIEIGAAGGLEEHVEYAADVTVAASFPSPALLGFAERIRELSAGQVTVFPGEEEFRAR